MEKNAVEIMTSVKEYAPSDRRPVLPGDRTEKQIRDMKPGEAGWSVPWALHVDPDGRMWLNPKYAVGEHPGGTVQLLISRHEDGFWANVQSIVFFNKPYLWSRGGAPPDGYIPVVHIH